MHKSNRKIWACMRDRAQIWARPEPMELFHRKLGKETTHSRANVTIARKAVFGSAIAVTHRRYATR